jgi:hypothetical protein
LPSRLMLLIPQVIRGTLDTKINMEALLDPAGQFIRSIVIPRSWLFTGLLIAFQLLMAIAILSRGRFVGDALLAGAAFSVMAALVSNIPGAIANLVFAAVQAFLAFTR